MKEECEYTSLQSRRNCHVDSHVLCQYERVIGSDIDEVSGCRSMMFMLLFLASTRVV